MNQGWLWVACNDGLLRIRKKEKITIPSLSMMEYRDPTFYELGLLLELEKG